MRIIPLLLFPLLCFGEMTLSIIKPDSVADHRIGAIISRFEKEGLNIVAMKQVHLTQKQVEQFYAEHQGKPFYEKLTEYMSSGPIVALVLEGNNAIVKNRTLMGATDPKKAAPGTIRADFARSIDANAIHGSDSPDNAKREIAFFFSSLDLNP